MSLSGKEEPKLGSGLSSIASAGVPIKKRRFPLAWPNSPPSVEQNDSSEKAQSIRGELSSVVNTSVVSSSTEKADACVDQLQEFKGELSVMNTDIGSSSTERAIACENQLVEVKKEIASDINGKSIFTDSHSAKVSEFPGPRIKFVLGSSPDTVDSKHKVMQEQRPIEETAALDCEFPVPFSPNESIGNGRQEAFGEVQVGNRAVPENATFHTKLNLQLPHDDYTANTGAKYFLKDYVGTSTTQEGISSFSELSLRFAKESSSNLGKGVQIGTSVKCELTTIPEDSELSFGPKEHIAPSSYYRNCERSSQLFDALDQSSFCLSLSNEKCISPSQSGDSDPKSDEPRTHSERCNWDLNMALDSWDDSVGEVPGPETVVFKEILGNVDGKGKQIMEEGDFQQFNPNDSLGLSLGTLCSSSNFRGEHSGASSKTDFSTVIPMSVVRGDPYLIGNVDAALCPDVKPEPCDASAEQNHSGPSGETSGLLDNNARYNAAELFDCRTSNGELVPRVSLGGFRSSITSPHVEVEHRPVKSEQLSEGNQRTMEPIFQKSADNIVPHHEIASSFAFGSGIPPELLITGKEQNLLQAGSAIASELKSSSAAPAETFGNVDLFASEIMPNTADHGKSNEGDITLETDEAPQNSRSPGKGCESDDEKISLSNDLQEEDSYGSGYESDCNQARSATENENHGKDEEYEDGEFRGSALRIAAEASINEGEAKNGNSAAECNNKDSNDACFDPANEKESEAEDGGELKDICIYEHQDAALYPKFDNAVDDEVVSSHGIDPTEKEDVKMAITTELAKNGDQSHELTMVQGSGVNVEATNRTAPNNLTLHNSEVPVPHKDANDSNTGGIRSRIITLPRASNVMPLQETRSIPGRYLGKERITDFDGEKLHQPRHRDEVYSDDPGKFTGGRNQGQPFRNFGQSHGRGRGRIYGLSESFQGDWDSSDRASGNCNGPTDNRVPRHKRHADLGDVELESSNDLHLASDKDFVGSGRLGRRPTTDELPTLRHESSRRLSPVVRGRPSERGPVEVLRRFPRNIGSSDEFAGERGMSDRDTMFSRPQQRYEGMEGQFLRDNRRNFSSGQRGSDRRIRSRSPRSRTRSPGPWSSPRRRSPDGFVGFTQRRSPVMYRIERIRSPETLGFPDEVMARRIRQPSNGYMRSIFPTRRSPSDRVLPRSSRIFDTLDSRERMGDDDYIGGGNDRRNFADRRGGLVRSFRTSGGGEGENFHRRVQEDSRSFRPYSKAESEYIERGNFRVREVERRTNGRNVFTPRRMRNIDEPEGNHRQGGQSWHADDFDDGSRGKRRRF